MGMRPSQHVRGGRDGFVAPTARLGDPRLDPDELRRAVPELRAADRARPRRTWRSASSMSPRSSATDAQVVRPNARSRRAPRLLAHRRSRPVRLRAPSSSRPDATASDALEHQRRRLPQHVADLGDLALGIVETSSRSGQLAGGDQHGRQREPRVHLAGFDRSSVGTLHGCFDEVERIGDPTIVPGEDGERGEGAGERGIGARPISAGEDRARLTLRLVDPVLGQEPEQPSEAAGDGDVVAEARTSRRARARRRPRRLRHPRRRGRASSRAAGAAVRPARRRARPPATADRTRTVAAARWLVGQEEVDVVGDGAAPRP